MRLACWYSAYSIPSAAFRGAAPAKTNALRPCIDYPSICPSNSIPPAPYSVLWSIDYPRFTETLELLSFDDENINCTVTLELLNFHDENINRL
jgi:hypothetical protein